MIQQFSWNAGFPFDADSFDVDAYKLPRMNIFIHKHSVAGRINETPMELFYLY